MGRMGNWAVPSYAVRCNANRSALRWPMQRTALGNAPRCDNRRRTLPCGKEQRKAFCPPGFRLRKLPVIRLQDAAGLAAFILSGAFPSAAEASGGAFSSSTPKQYPQNQASLLSWLQQSQGTIGRSHHKK